VCFNLRILNPIYNDMYYLSMVDDFILYLFRLYLVSTNKAITRPGQLQVRSMNPATIVLGDSAVYLSNIRPESMQFKESPSLIRSISVATNLTAAMSKLLVVISRKISSISST